MRKRDLKRALHMAGIACRKLEADLHAAEVRESNLRTYIDGQRSQIGTMKAQIDSLAKRVREENK